MYFIILKVLLGKETNSGPWCSEASLSCLVGVRCVQVGVSLPGLLKTDSRGAKSGESVGDRKGSGNGDLGSRSTSSVASSHWFLSKLVVLLVANPKNWEQSILDNQS